MVKELKLNELEKVTQENSLVFLDFFANWCGPCRAMMPVVEELSEELDGKVAFFKVNVDDNADFAEKFQVMSIPCFFVIKDGKVDSKTVGTTTKEVLKAKLGLWFMTL